MTGPDLEQKPTNDADTGSLSCFLLVEVCEPSVRGTHASRGRCTKPLSNAVQNSSSFKHTGQLRSCTILAE
jgi:hypothetical protein